MTTALNHENISPSTYAFGLVASGTTQSGAAPIPARVNVFTTVAAGQACLLGVAGRPVEVRIINYGANTLTVFPPGGWSFNNGTINASVTIPAGDNSTFYAGDPNESSWWVA